MHDPDELFFLNRINKGQVILVRMISPSIFQIIVLADVVVILVAIIVFWIIISLPIYFSAKVVTGGKASLGAAMGATVAGPIVYVLTFIATSFLFRAFLGGGLGLVALMFAFLAWLAVYKTAFQTGWLGALAITIIAVLIYVVLAVILTSFFEPFPGSFLNPIAPERGRPL